jgi:cytochrome c553
LLLSANLATAADAAAGKVKAQACVACHGEAGISATSAFPSLAGQPPLFIVYQLIQYRGNQRVAAPMNAVAANMSDADMRDLGAYFSSLPGPVGVTGLDPAKVAAGQRISDAAHCQSCHTPDLRGQKQVPRLAGQHADYLKGQLKGLRDGTRMDIDGSMASAAQGLSDADIEAVAMFAASMNVAASPAGAGGK